MNLVDEMSLGVFLQKLGDASKIAVCNFKAVVKKLVKNNKRNLSHCCLWQLGHNLQGTVRTHTSHENVDIFRPHC